MNFDQAEALVNKLAARPGLRGKVDAKCVDCIYDPKGRGNWRQQVSACTVVACPLYDVRPVSHPKKKVKVL